MGTRHLTCVKLNGVLRVAQYGQWDGYPMGQGRTVRDFALLVSSENAWDAFARRVVALGVWTDDEITAAANEFAGAVGWTLEQSDKFSAAHPELSRDTGARILELIADGTVKRVQTDESFGIDGLFCEWAYILDLDAKTFQVYEGFKSADAATVGHWAAAVPASGAEYGPVSLVGVYSFGSLPNDTELEQLESNASES